MTATRPGRTGDQLVDLACVRCGERLPRHPDQVRELPAVEDRGRTCRAFAHTPDCPALPRRAPGAAWPAGGPPATAAGAAPP